MGYQAEKNRIEKKLRLIKLITLCVVMAAVLGLCIFSAFCPPDTWKYYVRKPKLDKRAEGELRIHFLDVGQGDATLIELPDGKVALIDGGDSRESTAETILRHMNALKIDTVDYLIVTHADADHCGSLARVLQCKKVLNAYLPIIKPENAGEAYQAFYAQLLEEECAMLYGSRAIQIGDSNSEHPYTFSFLYPYSLDATEENAEYATDNNSESSVLWLDYFGVSALFTGDAPTLTEGMLMRDDEMGALSAYGVDLKSTEILKVAHHGSNESSALEFLQYLQIQTAVISCGRDNIYGHPTSSVVDNLTAVGATTYRTDWHGSVIVTIRPQGEYDVEKLGIK